MTNAGNTPAPLDEVESILADLRQTPDSAEEVDSKADRDLDHALRSLIAPSPETAVAGALQELVPSTWPFSLDVSRRRRLLTLLDEQLGERARNTGLLQTILRAQRQHNQESLAHVAEVVNTFLGQIDDGSVVATEALLRGLESGIESAHSEQAATVLSVWAASSHVPDKVASRAFRDSVKFEHQSRALSAAAGRADEPDVEHLRLDELVSTFDAIFNRVVAVRDAQPGAEL